ncbi:Trm112 family protein [Zavarzinia compransoris]|uniref:Trm112 family protein n=1 Tax=Zavarzinia marina TaxID=2911065 RepID=UPI001F288D6F|nr:Trm112 family protein [Zavarzinia marina]MCF4167493.1 Trm112 family protein [Zavarzinia marina]
MSDPQESPPQASPLQAPETETADRKAARNAVDPKLLEILICPASRKPLRYDRERNELISDAARLAYPIRDGVPIMLIGEARNLDDSEVEA